MKKMLLIGLCMLILLSSLVLGYGFTTQYSKNVENFPSPYQHFALNETVAGTLTDSIGNQSGKTRNVEDADFRPFADIVGNAIVLDGSNENIESKRGWNTGDPLTISLWINSTATTGKIMGNIDGATWYGFSMQINGNDIRFSCGDLDEVLGTSMYDFNGIWAVMNDGNWHHFVFRKFTGDCVSANFELWVDGYNWATRTVVGDRNDGGSVEGRNISFGEVGYGSSYTIERLDEILIFNATLETGAIQTLNLTNYTYAAAPEETVGGINVTIITPTNGTAYSWTSMTANGSKVWINATHNESGGWTAAINDTRWTLNSNTTNITYFLNNTPLTSGWYHITVTVNKTGTKNGSDMVIFKIDTSIPVLTTIYENNTFVYIKNLTGQFNFSDNLLLHKVNISINNENIFSITDLARPEYVYNLSYNISTLPIGKNNLSIRFADGHTAEELNEDYGGSTGLFEDYLKYNLPDGNYILTKSKTSSIFDRWTTERKTNRYIQIYEPSAYGNTQTFIEKSNKRIYIIKKPEHYKGSWIIIGEHWKDYVLKDEPNSKVSIKRISDYEVEVTITNITNNQKKLVFDSIGDLNIVTRNFTFYKINLTDSFEENTTNGFEFEINLTVDFGNLMFDISSINPSAILEWNGTNYTTTLDNFNSSEALFHRSFIIDHKEQKKVINHTWFFNFTINHTLFQTERQDQNNTQILVDKCGSSSPFPIANFTYFDEVSELAITLDHTYQYKISDGTYYYNQTSSFTGNTTDSFCTNLNPSSVTYNWNMWGIATLSKGGYVTRIVDTDEATPFLISNNPTKNISYYLIDLLNSSSVTFNWYTTDLAVIDGTMRIFQCNDDGTLSLTDSLPVIAGLATGNMELLTQSYYYDITIDGNLYTDTSSFSRCHIESATEITFFVEISPSSLLPIIGLNGINCILNKSGNDSVILKWGPNPNDNTFVHGCVEVYRMSVVGNTQVFQNCSSEAEGYEREVIVPYTGNDYIVICSLKQGDNTKICGELIFYAADEAAGTFGITALLAAFFLITGMILIYAGEGVLQLSGGAIGILVAWYLGLLSLPWITVSSIIAFLVIVMLVVRYSTRK